MFDRGTVGLPDAVRPDGVVHNNLTFAEVVRIRLK